jgi:hypothetical protein
MLNITRYSNAGVTTHFIEISGILKKTMMYFMEKRSNKKHYFMAKEIY